MIGLILIILAQVSYAIAGLLMRKYLSQYSPIFVTGVMTIVSTMVFLPIILMFYRSESNNMTFKSALPFVASAIIWVVISETLFMAGLQRAPSLALASLMALFYPLFSTILGIIFLKESLSVKTIIAGVLMIAGFIFLVV